MEYYVYRNYGIFRGLELSAFGNDDRLSGGTGLTADFLDSSNYIHTFGDLAKNDVFAVQPTNKKKYIKTQKQQKRLFQHFLDQIFSLNCNSGGDKELATVGVWSAVSHGQETWSNVLFDEVFVSEFFAVDRFSAGSVLSSEIASLAHETWDDSVEWTSFVAETFFSGAQSSEVFDGFWYNIVVHFENDSTGWFTANGHVKVAGDRHVCSLLVRSEIKIRGKSVKRDEIF